MAANDMDNLNGLFKKQYAPKMEDLVPEFVLLQGQGALIQHIPQNKRPGDHYAVPTVLRSNQGVTYAGESGGVTTLRSAKPGLMKEAQIRGSEMVIRGRLSYGALSRAAQQGAQAFQQASAWLVEDLARVAHTRLEFSALYGQDNVGEIESITGDGTPGTPFEIVITHASFSPGIWAVSEGATLEVYSAAGALRGSAGLVIEVVGVDTTARKIICEIHNGMNSGGGGPIAPSDTIHFESARAGATSWNEMVGLKKQFTATSGTLFNIERSHSLMQGNLVDLAGDPFSKALITSANMLAVNKGAMSKVTVLVSTEAFATLHADDMALQRFDSSYSKEKATSGTRKIEYQSVNGAIEIVCHPLVKNGDAFLFNTSEVFWIGSRKPAFDLPGTDGLGFWQRVADSTSVELQNYSDLAVYCLKPARTVFITGGNSLTGV